MNINPKLYSSNNCCSEKLGPPRAKSDFCPINTVCDTLKTDHCTPSDQCESYERTACMNPKAVNCSPLKPPFEDHRDVFRNTMTCREVVDCCPDKSGRKDLNSNLSIAKKACNSNRRSNRIQNNSGNSCNTNKAQCKRIICPEKCGPNKTPFEQNRMYMCSTSEACQQIDMKHQEIQRSRQQCASSATTNHSHPDCSNVITSDQNCCEQYQKCNLNLERYEPSRAVEVHSCPTPKKGCCRKLCDLFRF